ncbi:MAG: hypothetical protein JXA49_04455 [Actinobacteria bacterium]|nr:hypothetical protein [Actinomycetota bacterium]
MVEKKEYLVRKYDPKKDLEGATKCMIEGFDHILWPLYDYTEGFAEAFVKMVTNFCSSTYIAEADGEARGLLAGSYMDMKQLQKFSQYAITDLGLPFMTGRFKFHPFARINAVRIVAGFLPFAFKHPFKLNASETVLLCSQKDYRGGIGRAMMDAWLEDSRGYGFDDSTVCTDSALSWDFYERYGFNRIVEFPMIAYHYSRPGEKHTGYIYRIGI